MSPASTLKAFGPGCSRKCLTQSDSADLDVGENVRREPGRNAAETPVLKLSAVAKSQAVIAEMTTNFHLMLKLTWCYGASLPCLPKSLTRGSGS